ncbi:hypothetical protein SBOR_2403 [Sclerotinia borealis F-4128]|uniref:Uncharacterized protein n=1 Tax=Sclerotinia borealis (strain F-4128) TaxID=1432307 RepID=W9CRI9_SCLBF|nr:hypothetical protein SBOR_2403 [Sclerotinia borealis F-4128]
MSNPMTRTLSQEDIDRIEFIRKEKSKEKAKEFVTEMLLGHLPSALLSRRPNQVLRPAQPSIPLSSEDNPRILPCKDGTLFMFTNDNDHPEITERMFRTEAPQFQRHQINNVESKDTYRVAKRPRISGPRRVGCLETPP